MNQALLTALEEVAARIPEIQANRQYWFIRTNGGLFYDDFLHTGSVGIGYNMVTWAQIRAAFAKNKDAEGGIVSAVVSRYPDFDKNQLGRVVGLFSRFYLDMQPGDVVVMPSGGSHEYAFGIVTDGEPFEVETTTTDDKSIYRKRRPVDWIVRKPWQSMDSNLYEAFRATQAMTTLNPYASFLDREMHSLYTKDGQTHVRLDITTTEEINGADYFSMGSALLNLCAWFADEAGLSLAESEIDVRQNIQSPGKLELIAKKLSMGAFIAAALTVSLIGGHAKSDTFKIDISAPGLVPLMLEAYKEHNRQENMKRILDATLPKMKAEQAADMLRIVAGQAPAPADVSPAASTEPPATAVSSAAAEAAATASLAKPASSPTLADPATSAPLKTPPEIGKHP
jgi:restriction system protein